MVVPAELYEIASRLSPADAARLRAAADEIVSSRLMARDHRSLVRMLDKALNGDGAAKQASLVDLVSQVVDQRWKLVRVD